MISITIGRNQDNDIVIKDPSVSGRHLLLQIDDDVEGYHIKDLNSTNGTQVDGVPIMACVWDGSGDLRLGSKTLDTEELREKIVDIQNRKKTDFRMEYQALMKEFEVYQGKKDKILRNPILPFILRVGPGVIIIIVMLLAPSLIPGEYRYPIMSGAGLMAFAAGFFNSSAAKRSKKMDLLRLEYEDKLVCPKCRSKMLHHGLHYWIGKDECNNTKCDAKFK